MDTVRYIKQARVLPRKVFFTGTGALVKGQGVCFDRDYGTAADREYRRDSYVALPSRTNNLAFAGVCAKSYDANAAGQMIEIYEPGSVCEVAVGVDTVVDSTILTCSAGEGDPGRFAKPGFMGRGSAIALQTLTNLVGSSYDGTAAVSAGETLTKTGAFAGAAAGDKVYILGGASSAGVDAVTPGEYTIASVTSNDAVELTTAPGNGQVVFYCISGNKTCLALLLDGEESGLVDFISPIDNAAAAPVAMVGGTTYVCGGYTIGAGDSTLTLADGTRMGMKKMFIGLGTLTTNDMAITVTSGIQKDHSTALAKVEIDAAAEEVQLTWRYDKWVCDWTAGATIS